MLQLYSLLAILFIVFHKFSAKTIYISPNGDDAATGLDSASPWQTFARTFDPNESTFIASGDSVVLMAGTYTPGATGVLAMGLGDACNRCPEVIPDQIAIMGELGFVRMDSVADGFCPLILGTDSLKVTDVTICGVIFYGGVKFVNTDGVMLCDFGAYGPLGREAVVTLGSVNCSVTNSLIERGFVWGQSKHTVLNDRTNFTIVRRVVARPNAECYDSYSRVTFHEHNSQDTYYQNVLSLDADGNSSCIDQGKHYDFREISEAGPGFSALPTGPTHYQGVMALNSRRNCYQSQKQQTAGDPSTRAENMVCWGTRSGFDIGGDGGQTRSDQHEYFTLGEVEQPNVVRIRGQPSGYYFLKNGIIHDFTDCALSGPTINSAENIVTWSPNGTQTCQAACFYCHEIDSVSSSLIHLPRIEDGTTLAELGSSQGRVGADVQKAYGLPGTFWGTEGFSDLTDVLLWPFPNEDEAKFEFCQGPYAADVDTGLCSALDLVDGLPASITQYFWEYLGFPIPPAVYDPHIPAATLAPTAGPTLEPTTPLPTPPIPIPSSASTPTLPAAEPPNQPVIIDVEPFNDGVTLDIAIPGDQRADEYCVYYQQVLTFPPTPITVPAPGPFEEETAEQQEVTEDQEKEEEEENGELPAVGPPLPGGNDENGENGGNDENGENGGGGNLKLKSSQRFSHKRQLLQDGECDNHCFCDVDHYCDFYQDCYSCPSCATFEDPIDGTCPICGSSRNCGGSNGDDVNAYYHEFQSAGGTGVDYFTARDDCVARSGQLSTLHSAAENDAAFQACVSADCWIGVYSPVGSHDALIDYSWPDGSPMDYLNWNPSEPDEDTTGDSCAIYRIALGTPDWFDFPCSSLYSYICQFENYWIESSALSWLDAQAACNANLGQLVSIHDEQMNSMFFAMCPTTNCWTGMNDIQTEGVYQNTDNSPADYLFWDTNRGQPGGGSEDCVRFSGGGDWYTSDCSAAHPFICQAGFSSPAPTAPPTLDPTKAPTSSPSDNPTAPPTKQPSQGPTVDPVPQQTAAPVPYSTAEPTPLPTYMPTPPTSVPTATPTLPPGQTHPPSDTPTIAPTIELGQTVEPTIVPTTALPTAALTDSPTVVLSPVLVPHPASFPTPFQTNSPVSIPSMALVNGSYCTSSPVVIISGLPTGTIFAFTVTAENANGISELSDSVTILIKEPPIVLVPIPSQVPAPRSYEEESSGTDISSNVFVEELSPVDDGGLVYVAFLFLILLIPSCFGIYYLIRRRFFPQKRIYRNQSVEMVDKEALPEAPVLESPLGTRTTVSRPGVPSMTVPIESDSPPVVHEA